MNNEQTLPHDFVLTAFDHETNEVTYAWDDGTQTSTFHLDCFEDEDIKRLGDQVAVKVDAMSKIDPALLDIDVVRESSNWIHYMTQYYENRIFKISLENTIAGIQLIAQQ